jgi:hypothetical protein
VAEPAPVGRRGGNYADPRTTGAAPERTCPAGAVPSVVPVKQTLSDPLRRAVFLAWLLAAAGIVVQIAGGWPYPVVPPGLLICLAAAASALVPPRWGPAVAVLAGAFLLFGFVAVGDLGRLLGTENALVTVGKWMQLAGSLAGTAAAVTALVRPPTRRRIPTG